MISAGIVEKFSQHTSPLTITKTVTYSVTNAKSAFIRNSNGMNTRSVNVTHNSLFCLVIL